MAFSMKVIKPKALLFDTGKIERGLESELDERIQDVRADFLETVATWSSKGGKPQFGIIKRRSERLIYTANQKYIWVNSGTRAHIIRASGSRLAFPANYAAKTSPRVIASHAGGGSGATVYARQVVHPGTEAREFDKAIAEKHERTFPQAMQRAITRLAQ